MMVGGGVGTMVLALVVYMLGGDPSVVLQNAPQRSGPTKPPTAEENKQAEFVSVVLADTEDTWSVIFRDKLQAKYTPPTLVLFTDAVQSGCGTADASVGPFYCPPDQKVYIDLAFYRDLQARFGAPGDFAQAYVIAHEVGHHVQNLLGVSDKVGKAGPRASKGATGLSVRTELQADCFAGVWAKHAQKVRNILEPGDIEEALGAASAIGDDRLQKQGSGRVVPDAFTHGSSEQRVRWFKTGFDGGDPSRCDTFAASTL